MTPADDVVARLDSYSQEQHREFIEAARKRSEVRRQKRVERARAAADRLRAYSAHQTNCPRCRDPFGVATPCNREDQP